MAFTYIRRTAVALALIATAGCTVKNTELLIFITPRIIKS